jgi:hypothetical protein
MLRAMRDQPTSVAIHPARYADFDAERWWQTRDGAALQSSNGRSSCSTTFSIRCNPLIPVDGPLRDGSQSCHERSPKADATTL